ncbi:snRNA-activating protein complex subunit 3 [Aethina tumida]|uniref:snRNA-activating protein complex subunit 3 n=1 Tax=Aethina tumida TaxID=116153 RepID=UPI002148FF4A|nr:snRNA-activating protein complex subunit 3 [Aethina tumida]
MLFTLVNMEKIYKPQLFRATENINLKEYFDKFKAECLNYDVDKTAKSLLKKLKPKLTTEQLNSLAENCSTDLLKSPENSFTPSELPTKYYYTSKLDSYYPVTEKALTLSSVRYRVSVEKALLEKNLGLESLFFNRSTLKLSGTTPADKAKDIEPGSEYVLTIFVYKATHQKPYQKTWERLKCAQEFQALGSSLLIDVIEKIHCVTNDGLFLEVENTDIDLTALINAKKYYPSQYIFIDGVFYCDSRAPNAYEYPKEIAKWAADKGIGKLTMVPIENVKIDALKPRLGYPYVYLHQGDCEHLIVFADARLIHAGDALCREVYPNVTRFRRVANVMCLICTHVFAKWIVYGCDRLPQEKAFLCTECCNSYCYLDGKKIGKFKLYPYFHKGLINKQSSGDDVENDEIEDFD